MMDELIVKNEEEKKVLAYFKVALHHFQEKVRKTILVTIAGL